MANGLSKVYKLQEGNFATALKQVENPIFAVKHLFHNHPEIETLFKEYLTLSIPEIKEGRRVINQEQLANGTVLRLEYVPCRSVRCKKNPDEHGPYWYSYRVVNNKWEIHYYGSVKPTLSPAFSVNDAKTIIDRIKKQPQITDENIHTLYRIIATFSEGHSNETENLKKLAINLINQEEIRRDKIIHERHDLLLAKAESGKRLTPTEQKELHKTTALLAGEH